MKRYNSIPEWLIPKITKTRVKKTILLSVTAGVLLCLDITPMSKGQARVDIYKEYKHDWLSQAPDRGKSLKIYECTVIFLTSGTSTTIPADWNSANNSVECIGGGGSGKAGDPCSGGGGGGGGGGYSKILNETYTQSASRTIAIGGVAGDTSMKKDDNSTTACLAKGGATATSTTGGIGGAAASGTGATKTSGGAGGNGFTVGGGGGGAGGPSADGVAGANGTGTGNGGAGNGGAGGAGGAAGAPGGVGGDGLDLGDGTKGTGGGGGAGNGASSAGGAGGLYGGGGGGGQILTGAAGVGKQGLIVLTYTAGAAPIPFTVKQWQDPDFTVKQIMY